MGQLHRFFLALVPPEPIQQYTREIQQDFAERYASRAAQKSPPHITLQPPFEWASDDRETLEQRLQEFASWQASIPVTLAGFAAFPPRVIYINVLKTPELMIGQQALMNYVAAQLGIVDPRAQGRPFTPHMTVAFRDLSKQNFKIAWPEFCDRALQDEFIATHLTLLIHNGQRWIVCSQFPFLG